MELKPNLKFGSGGPLQNHVGNECGSCRQRKWRSLHHVESICSAPNQEVNQICRQYTVEIHNSAVVASRELGSRFEPARLRRPRLTPRPAPRPSRKTTLYVPNGYAGERGAAPPPAQLRTPAANAPPGFKFPGRGGISADPCTPRMCWAQSPLRPRDYKLPKWVLPVPGPPTGFYFRFPTRKNDGPNRTCHGTRPQDGRRYAVPPSPTGQASKSPAFQA